MLKILGGILGVIALAALMLWFYIGYERAPDKRAFINGQVLTMDADDSITQALFIDAGRVVAVGSNDVQFTETVL